ncbi:hypothetical protein, partial [Candidatus Hodarchaeum mangrovi]
NDEFGVSIPANHMNNIEITWNCFIGNNPSGSSQAFDGGTDNSFKYNYWDDWVSQSEDNDGNGILDTDYPIGGATQNYDRFPRAKCCMYILTQATPSLEFSVGLLGICITSIIFSKKRSR